MPAKHNISGLCNLGRFPHSHRKFLEHKVWLARQSTITTSTRQTGIAASDIIRLAQQASKYLVSSRTVSSCRRLQGENYETDRSTIGVKALYSLALPANPVLRALVIEAKAFQTFRVLYSRGLKQPPPASSSFGFGVGRYSTLASAHTITSPRISRLNHNLLRFPFAPQHLSFTRLFVRAKHSHRSKKTSTKSKRKRGGKSGSRIGTFTYNPAKQPRVTWNQVIGMEPPSGRDREMGKSRGDKGDRDRGDRDRGDRDRGDRDRGDRDRGDRDRGHRERGSRGAQSEMHRFGEGNVRQDFQFEAERKLPSRDSTGGDSYRPGGGYNADRDRRDRPNRERDSRDRGRGGGGYGRGGRGGGDGGVRKPWVPAPAHSRPMMVYKREKTPEQLEGMVSSGLYLEAESEEGEDNEIGNEEDGDGSVQMELDYQGVEVEAETVAPVVPVEDITEGVEVVKAEKAKLDVIAMIRQAKAKPAAATAQRNAVAANDDFISFGFSDDEKEIEKEKVIGDREISEDYRRRMDAHAPPRDRGFSHRESFHQNLDDRKNEALPPPGTDVGPPGAAGLTIIPSSLPPPPGLATLPIGGKAPESAVPGGIAFSLPPKPPPSVSLPITPNLGPWPPPPTASAAEVILISSSPTPPHQQPSSAHGKKRKLSDTGFNVQLTPVGLAPEYRLLRNSEKNPTPWLLHDHSRTLHPSDQLHKEIHDFITFIRPRRYEHAVRRHVIHRIRTAITSSISDVDVRVFGSFAAEIYLPSSDLDLAVISRDFARTGMPKYANKGTLHRVSGLLRRAKIPKDGQIAVISKAKVPILKFVDALTGLQVDICFENLSGVNANGTFRKWREEYPAMPALAMIVKQFLELRKQNEVYFGGLGGFTVICLVVSLLQLHPGFSSGNVPVEKNLGIGLMEFFDLYGRKFKIDKVGIDVRTRSYFRKPYTPVPRPYTDPKSKEYRDYWILHVVDPNDPDNNIARSSYGVREIFEAFADGFKVLEGRMKEIHESEFDERKEIGGGSVLGAILGGNYEGVEKQRAVMRRVYEDVFGEVARDDEIFSEEGQPWRWVWDSELTGDGEGSGFVVDVKGLVLNGKTRKERKERKDSRRGKGKKARSGDEEGSDEGKAPLLPGSVSGKNGGHPNNPNNPNKRKKKNKAPAVFASNEGGGSSPANGSGGKAGKIRRKKKNKANAGEA